MKFETRVRNIGPVDISNIRARVNSVPESLWHRNAEIMAVQAHTLTIPLREVCVVPSAKLVYGTWDEKDDTPVRCKGMFEEWKDDIDAVVSQLIPHYGYKKEDVTVINVIVARLLKKSLVYAHMDAEWGTLDYLFWESVHRIHVPIKTQPGVEFMVADRDYVDREAFFDSKGFKPEDHLYLKENQAYEVNNLRFHAVQNNSDDYRDHFIIDIRHKSKNPNN